MVLDTVRWERVCELVDEALALPPEERVPLLQRCEPDAEVREEAASLLAASRSAGETFLAGDIVSEGLVSGASSPWDGRLVGPYRVLREIGHGGMGVVLLAARADDLYERQVAIKVVRADLTGDLFLRRFRKEIRTLAHFDHPAIARLLDAGITGDGAPYLVMEYIDGTPIDRFCREHQASVATVLKLMIEITEAASYAHRLAVVHRDLKPGNILVTATGEPKLLDFGIAKLPAEGLEDGVVMTELRAWTPAYASPEQIAGGPGTAQSDVYSLGVLLYLLLTEQLPYCCDGLSPAEIERSFASTVPVAPSRLKRADRRSAPLLSSVDPVVLKALQIEPSERYSSAADLADDLRRASVGDLTSAQMPSAGRRLLRWARRRRLPIASVAAVSGAISAAAFSGYLLWKEHRPSQASATAFRPSIAVLPLKNLRRERENDWISAAASEIVATELAAGDRVRVARPEDVLHAEQDLHLTTEANIPAPALADVARNVDSRYLLSGAYTAEGVAKEAHLRFDMALFDASSRQVLVKRSFVGTEQSISGVAGQIAQSMLQTLGVSSQGNALASAKTLPRNPEAVRWYAEGLRDLQLMNFMDARKKLDEAAAIESGSSMIHAASAEVWDGLGYHKRAQAEAARSVQLSGDLPKQAKLMVQGESLELDRNWARASEIFSTLHEFFPDDLEYGLHLARDQAEAHRVDAALNTLLTMRKGTEPFHDDPRIALEEARIAGAASRAKEEADAAGRALVLARERSATHIVAQALLAQAQALHYAGKDADAAKTAQEALATFDQTGDRRAQGLALNAIGGYRENLGDVEGASASFEQARDRFSAVGDVRSLAAALNSLGNVEVDRSRYTEALPLFRQAIALGREIDDASRIAGSLNNLANSESSLHHPEQARAFYEESLGISQSTGNRSAVAIARGNLATIFRSEGRLPEAKSSDEEALRIDRELGVAANLAWPLRGLARTALLSGDLQGARELFQQASEILRNQGYQRQLAYVLFARAEVEELMGNRPAQLAFLEEASTIGHPAGGAEIVIDCQLAKIKDRLRFGQTAGVAADLERILLEINKTDSAALAEAYAVRAQLAIAEKRTAAATDDLAKARHLLESARGTFEPGWEVDTIDAMLQTRDPVSRQRLDRQLRQDERKAQQLHNRPWLLRLRLAIAKIELARSREQGLRQLRAIAAEAHAMHAGGLEQAALLQPTGSDPDRGSGRMNHIR